jgi:hypothetical protein
MGERTEAGGRGQRNPRGPLRSAHVRNPATKRNEVPSKNVCASSDALLIPSSGYSTWPTRAASKPAS